MIGVFDSGLGGLTVVRQIFNQLPSYSILYLGDSANLPYGNKSPETITRYAKKNCEFLIEQGAKIIVVACNTASAVAFSELSRTFNLPLFEVITPAVTAAIAKTKNKKIGVIGTRTTVQSGIYKKLLCQAQDVQCFEEACPLLVPLVEEGWINQPETENILRKYLSRILEEKIDTLVTACTHYPLLHQTIEKVVGPDISIIDPAFETARSIKYYFKSHAEIEASILQNKDHRFCFTDLTDKTINLTKEWLQKDVAIERVEF